MKIALRVFFVAALLGVGVLSARTLIRMKPTAKRKAPENRGLLVQVRTFSASSPAMRVLVNGVARPARQISVVPQVSGKVIKRHDALLRRGLIAAGETVLQIERTDYEAQVSIQKAAVARTEHELAIERGRNKVAEREWRLVGGAITDAASKARALRHPQLAFRVAAVQAAKANLRVARANLGRTRITAPFNAVVLDSKVEIGQVVSSRAQVIQLAGTDVFWIEARVPVAELRWIRAADANGDTPGSTVRIAHDRGAETISREGRVERILSDLDPAGRMARILVRLDDPLGLETDVEPLHLGSYVGLEIIGRKAEGLFELPRSALREGETIWLADEHNQLAIRKVTVARRLRETVLIGAGLSPTDRVITSRLSLPVPGQKLRVSGAKGAETKQVRHTTTTKATP